MKSLDYFYNYVIRYDLINKYSYDSFKSIPRIEKIVLNVGLKNSDLTRTLNSALALEIVTNKSSFLTKSKKPNLFLKLRKGSPSGCSIVLKKKNLYFFLDKFLVEMVPLIDKLKIKKWDVKSNKNFSITIDYLSCFKELRPISYLFFVNYPLNIVFITNTKSNKELVDLLQLYNFPIT